MLTSKLFCIFALTLASNAYPSLTAIATPPCANPTIVGNMTIAVGGDQVVLNSFNCPSLQPQPAVNPRATYRNVCGEPCSSANCGSTVSPPGLNRNDCTTIATAITILQASLGTTYNLDSSNGYYKQLNFGSCVAYIGVSAQQPTQACWSDLASVIRLLNTNCATSKLGVCTSFPPDISWADWSSGVGAF